MSKLKTLSKSLLYKGLKAFGFVLYVFSLTIYAASLQAQASVQAVPAQESITNTFSDALSARSKLPVNQNRFVVDKGVTQIDVLVNTDQFSSIQLVSPQGKVFIPSDATANISWQRIEKLYAIKIPFPTAGQWLIQGKLLSYPEVIVSANLDMVTPQFPDNLIRGETIALSAYLQEDGKKITQGELLGSTQITASLQNMGTAEIYKIYLVDESKSDNNSKGIFAYDYPLVNLPGVYSLDILAVGLLFQREKHHQFYLHDYPGTVSTEVDAQDDEMNVKVHLASPLLNTSTFQISANMQNFDGSSRMVRFDKQDPANWVLNYPASEDITKMTVTIAGYLKDARQVQISFPEVNVQTIYAQAYLAAKENQALKSNQEWQRQQTQLIEAMLPFSISKQRESYIIDANLIDDPTLKPLTNYSNYFQSLIQEWEPKLFGNQEEEWLKRGAEEKKTVLTKEQIKANMLAAEKAKAKAKAKKDKEALLAKKKKLLIIVFSVFCLVFLAMLAGMIWYFIAPLRRKPEEAQSKASAQEAVEAQAPAQEEAKPEAKSEETKPEAKVQAKPEAKEEAKPEAKEEAKPEAKEEAKPEAKEETKLEPEAKPETKLEGEALQSEEPAKPQAEVAKEEIKLNLNESVEASKEEEAPIPPKEPDQKDQPPA